MATTLPRPSGFALECGSVPGPQQIGGGMAAGRETSAAMHPRPERVDPLLGLFPMQRAGGHCMAGQPTGMTRAESGCSLGCIGVWEGMAALGEQPCSRSAKWLCTEEKRRLGSGSLFSPPALPAAAVSRASTGVGLWGARLPALRPGWPPAPSPLCAAPGSAGASWPGTASVKQKSLPALGGCSGFVLIERLFSRRRAGFFSSSLLTRVQMRRCCKQGKGKQKLPETQLL